MLLKGSSDGRHSLSHLPGTSLPDPLGVEAIPSCKYFRKGVPLPSSHMQALSPWKLEALWPSQLLKAHGGVGRGQRTCREDSLMGGKERCFPPLLFLFQLRDQIWIRQGSSSCRVGREKELKSPGWPLFLRPSVRTRIRETQMQGGHSKDQP